MCVCVKIWAQTIIQSRWFPLLCSNQPPKRRGQRQEHVPHPNHGCCWETRYIFAHCGLVGNPHLTLEFKSLRSFQRQPRNGGFLQHIFAMSQKGAPWGSRLSRSVFCVGKPSWVINSPYGYQFFNKDPARRRLVGHESHPKKCVHPKMPPIKIAPMFSKGFAPTRDFVTGTRTCSTVFAELPNIHR